MFTPHSREHFLYSESRMVLSWIKQTNNQPDYINFLTFKGTVNTEEYQCTTMLHVKQQLLYATELRIYNQDALILLTQDL